MADLQITWDSPGPTASAFMKSNKFVRGIKGPVGSGKSVTCCMEIMRKAKAQKPDKQGRRRTRWAIVRNTNPQLKTTTIKTWNDWFDERLGKFKWSPPYTHHVVFMLEDNTRVEAEFIFLALDKPEDVKKLLSLELTGVFVNEAREIPKSIIDACTMRVGRFPAKKDGGATWYGVIMDTNSPDEEHWWAIVSGDVAAPEWMSPEEQFLLVKPDNWEFFDQPPAMHPTTDGQGNLTGYKLNPNRENGENLIDGYYENIIRGKTRSWINVYVLNKYQSLSDGKPVHPTFNPETHVSRKSLSIIPNVDIYVGIDFGRTPAAIVGQQLSNGRWLIVDEVIGKDIGAKRFAQRLKHSLSKLDIHENQVIKFYGDPAGTALSQADENSPFMMFRQAGIPVLAAPTNDPVVRIEAVDDCLNRLVDGYPCLVISKSCVMLKSGLAGGYQFRKKQVGGSQEFFEESPLKDRFSHPCDALQYLLVGGGEARRVLTGTTKARKATNARKGHYDPFAQRTVARAQKARGRMF